MLQERHCPEEVWKEVCFVFEEHVLDKYEVERSRRESYRESGEPPQCEVEVVERKTQMKTLGEHCWQKTHSLLKELLPKGKMCMQS